MILRQTFDKPINWYWDDESKRIFDWSIDSTGHDSKGEFVRIGSWSANHWFHVAKGKTDKLTLRNAMLRLRSVAKHHNLTCKFEYVIER